MKKTHLISGIVLSIALMLLLTFGLPKSADEEMAAERGSTQAAGSASALPPGSQLSAVGADSHEPEELVETAAANHDHSHHHSHDIIDQEKLDALIDKHINDEMRAEINEALKPGNRAPRIVEVDGHRVLDTSDRAGTVMVGIIDEDEGLIVTDFTQPLPDKAGAQ